MTSKLTNEDLNCWRLETHMEQSPPNDDHHKPLPLTVESLLQHIDKLEQIMLQDKDRISLLKSQLNTAEQRLQSVRQLTETMQMRIDVANQTRGGK